MASDSTVETSLDTGKIKNKLQALVGESRNREVAKILLRLRGESLMKAVAEGSKVPGTKLDYGNASAWLREIPGRFGQAKQEALLRYLGVELHGLNPKYVHSWILPPATGPELLQDLSDLLTVYAKQPHRFAWLKVSSSALQALAIAAGEVSIVFKPTAESNVTDMAQWLKRLGLSNAQNATSELIISDEQWRLLIAQQLLPDALWGAFNSAALSRWQMVIEWAIQQGLSPEDTLLRLKQAHSTDKV
jgi:hypothetical protein